MYVHSHIYTYIHGDIPITPPPSVVCAVLTGPGLFPVNVPYKSIWFLLPPNTVIGVIVPKYLIHVNPVDSVICSARGRFLHWFRVFEQQRRKSSGEPEMQQVWGKASACVWMRAMAEITLWSRAIHQSPVIRKTRPILGWKQLNTGILKDSWLPV